MAVPIARQLWKHSLGCRGGGLDNPSLGGQASSSVRARLDAAERERLVKSFDKRFPGIALSSIPQPAAECAYAVQDLVVVMDSLAAHPI